MQKISSEIPNIGTRLRQRPCNPGSPGRSSAGRHWDGQDRAPRAEDFQRGDGLGTQQQPIFFFCRVSICFICKPNDVLQVPGMEPALFLIITELTPPNRGESKHSEFAPTT